MSTIAENYCQISGVTSNVETGCLTVYKKSPESICSVIYDCCYLFKIVAERMDMAPCDFSFSIYPEVYFIRI
jgi:hypothetical protein